MVEQGGIGSVGQAMVPSLHSPLRIEVFRQLSPQRDDHPGIARKGEAGQNPAYRGAEQRGATKLFFVVCFYRNNNAESSSMVCAMYVGFAS